MNDIVCAYLPWLLSLLTILSMWLAGGMHRHTWLLGLGNQFLWLVWIVAMGAWGLLPMNAALWVIFARNHWKWSRQRRPV